MLTRENLIQNLLNSFPKFKETLIFDAEDEDFIYVIFGDFVTQFCESYLSGKVSDSEIENFFNFANEMAQSDDERVVNIFIVETLEILACDEKTIDLGKKYLNQIGVSLLNGLMAGWPPGWDE